MLDLSVLQLDSYATSYKSNKWAVVARVLMRRSICNIVSFLVAYVSKWCSACKGEKYLTEPKWMKALYCWYVFCPAILEWLNYWTLLTGPHVPEREAFRKKVVAMTGLHNYLQATAKWNPSF
ncbi:hypothetical protein QQ045_031654 [Rhodiola kirilowii]